MHTETEENYLKVIYHLSVKSSDPVNTSSIAGSLSTTSASVTDMLKKLSEKNLIAYERYKGVRITKKGEKVALSIIRKHRLWEVFLTKVLKFGWEEVHTMAEELEHVSSDELISRMDSFLGYPEVDPHGDPIPDQQGKIQHTSNSTLSEGNLHQRFVISGVNDHSTAFLQYLNRSGLKPGITVQITEIQDFDQSMEIKIQNKQKQYISHEVSRNLLVTPYGKTS
ncbi:metal-dependent transcriptional regulator [soil metagenome]